MCDPLTAAGIALSVGSTAYKANEQSRNQKRIVRARNNAAAAEDIRQRQYQDEASAIFDSTLPKFERGNQDVDRVEAQQKREAKLDNAARAEKATEYNAPSTASAPTVVKTEIARKITDALKKGSNRAKTQAKLGGYGDMTFGNQISLGRSRGELSQMSDFAGRSASLLPYEMQAAGNNASRAPSIVGDLLSLAGSGMTLAGMSGIGPSFGDLFGPTPLHQMPTATI